MEQSDQINNCLPADDELLSRENVFLGLFDKYNVDEGSDPELLEDVSTSTVSSESRDSDSSYSETSDCETEDDFDVEEMSKQLQPVIEDRVNAWSEKGINFQLKTVDRGVTVADWLEANREFKTTTKKHKKTVINENNKTTTITTTRTKTTTSRTAVNMFRNTNQFAQFKAITSGALDENEPSNEETAVETEMERRTDQNYLPNDLISSNRFDLPGGRQKQSTPVRRNLKRKVASPKMNILPPQTIKLRNRKKSVPTISDSDSGIFSNEVSNEVSNKVSNEVSNEVLNEVSNEVFNDVVMDASGHENVLEYTNPDQKKSDRSRKKATSQSRTSILLSKPRPPDIVIYSPGAGKRFGTRIDDKFMSVTKRDLKKGIDPKYHQYTDLSSMKKCIVPVNQRLVYAPPIDIAMGKSTNDNDDSETDDDLLTSYTTTGRFYRLNSK